MKLLILRVFKWIAKQIFSIADRNSLMKISNMLSKLNLWIESRLRQLDADKQQKCYSENDVLHKFILKHDAPWLDFNIRENQIPGMISEEERKYYTWLGQFYTGRGEIVELGPWLGCSTFYILEGLRQNPHFKGKKLYVYDDFVWRSAWMDRCYPSDDHPQDHEDFKYLFDRFTVPDKDFIVANRRRLSTGELEEDCGDVISPYDKIIDIPSLQWDIDPVEILFVDVGRTIDVNEAWWRVFFPHFIPNKTLIVMQDWQTHKEVPVKWYNQMKMFTDGKHQWLEIIHELSKGGIATFLFKG